MNGEKGEEELLPVKGTAADEGDDAKELGVVHSLLLQLFGHVEVDRERQLLKLEVDGCRATVDHGRRTIECADEGLRGRIRQALQRIQTALYPIDLQ
eukprot:TRINITY_DN6810_c0_g2_i2.p1 TRINITY_DN6810_c0_g2~~TRINITY_DN6810_c0_g2_i2.p1  ORF type:complete len:108 (-),score=31.30 TRINITY_DN6810_c0_g2_i2:20-310(-)